RYGRLQHARFELAVLAGEALTGQDLGLALEIARTRRLGPRCLHASAHHSRPARAAGAGRALVGKLDATAQGGVKHFVVGAAGEAVRSVPGADEDVHGRPVYPGAARCGPSTALPPRGPSPGWFGAAGERGSRSAEEPSDLRDHAVRVE